MTIDSMARLASAQELPDERGSAEGGVAGVISAGAMTFLLSGDLRLAMRATRLLIEDGRDDAKTPKASTRVRRHWRQPQRRPRIGR